MSTLVGRRAPRRRVIRPGNPAGVVVATLFYCWILFYVYRQLAPLYSYRGLVYRSPDPAMFTLAIVLTVTLAMLLPRRVRQPSDFLQWALFVVTVAPSIQVPQYAATLTPEKATATSIAVFVTGLLVRVAVLALPRLRFRGFRVEPSAVWLFLGLISIAVYAYLVIGIGLSFRIVAVTDVYDLRSEFRDATAASGILGYVIRIQSNVINPIFIARGIYSKRHWLWVAGLVGQVAIYSGTGFKSVLFSTPAIFAVALLFRTNLRLPGSRIVFGAGLGSVLAFGADRVLGGILWSSLFVRRLLLVPGALTAAYVLVFESRPKAYFRDIAFVPGSGDYGGLTASRLVGGVFVGDYGTASNTGFLGHGYLQAGFLGMFAEGLVIALALWAANVASRGLPTAVTCLVLTLPAINFANANPFTVMLTHGFAAALLAVAVLPRTGWGKRSAVSRPASPGGSGGRRPVPERTRTCGTQNARTSPAR